MLKKILITSTLVATTFAVAANAALPSGLYASGQIGYADTHIKSRVASNGSDFSNDGLAGRLAIGYKLTQHAALELGYLQLSSGKFNIGPASSFSNKQDAIDITAKGMLPITNNVNIYGKLGAAYLTTVLEAKSAQGKTTDLNSAQGIAKRTFAPEVAVGMGYDITPNVSVDTSITHIQTLGSKRPGNIDFLAVGIGYNFG